MPHTINNKVREWSRDAQTEVDYLTVFLQIKYLAENLFQEYLPTSGAGHLQFIDRLRDWLDCCPSEDDQKVLLQLVPHIFFIGSKEYDSLYQTAFNGPIARWLIDQTGTLINDADAKGKIFKAVSMTWFCGITDSALISKFYHLNGITGVEHRPDWRTLEKNGSEDWIASYMEDYGLQRIVLLEDFVGSGSQIETAVKFAGTLGNNCQVLLCPLVVCPKGASMGRQLEKDYPTITFSPVLELSSSIFVPMFDRSGEPELFAKIRDTITRLHPVVAGSGWAQDYGAFGYKETGGLTVMYSNCPDNTIPIIHHNSDGPWKALFHRSSRSAE